MSADHAKSHVVISRPHAAELEQPSDPVQRPALKTPGEAWMGIVVRTTVRRPEIRSAGDDWLA
jgi:hypothetical protein